jgi:hypothetical protein
MGDFNKPSVNMQDTTSPYLRGALQNPGQYLSGVNSNPLAMQAGAWMGNNTGQQGGSPEENALAMAMQYLPSMMRQSGTPNELNFSNLFSELQNPHGDVGAMNPAFGALAAASPIFDRNMQSTLAKVNAAAPGRFSSALAQEGRDVGTQAMQDFNLFAQQALSQGIGQQIQQQTANQNFMLGARGLQQQAQQDVSGNQLQARGLYQQGQQNGQNNQLQAMQMLGQLASQAGNGAFNRNLQAGQFGLQQQQQAVNPILQLLGLANPQTPIVGQSPLGTIMGGLGTLLGGAGALGWNPLGGGK